MTNAAVDKSAFLWRMRELSFVECKLPESFGVAINSTADMRSLTIWDCKFDDARLQRVLKNAHRMEKLAIGVEGISDEGLTATRRMPRLRTLDLENTRRTARVLNSINPDELEVLNISGLILACGCEGTEEIWKIAGIATGRRSVHRGRDECFGSITASHLSLVAR